LGLPGSSGQFFVVTFNQPQAAFGFFGSDVEVNQLQLTLVSTAGERRNVTVPVTLPQGTAGNFYFAVMDRADPFISVEFHNLGGSDDGFDLDDLTIATPQQVLPPTLAIRLSQVEICWDTVTNETYQLLYSTDLAQTNWLPLGGVITGNGLRYCTDDAIVPGNPQRYYKVVFPNSP
jgi:hypothetical protein